MLRRILTGFPILLFFVASFAGISIVVARAVIAHEERLRTVAVGSRTPDAFPVLVVFPSTNARALDARIVFHRALPDFEKTHPGYTFRIPPSEAARLNASLPGEPSLDPDSHLGAGRFEMREMPDGRQSVKVEGTWEDARVNVGWYETDGRTITPRSHLTYFGPGLVLKSLPISVAVTLALWGVAFLLFRRLKRRIEQEAAIVR